MFISRTLSDLFAVFYFLSLLLEHKISLLKVKQHGGSMSKAF
jgi:hypothetical protein